MDLEVLDAAAAGAGVSLDDVKLSSKATVDTAVPPPAVGATAPAAPFMASTTLDKDVGVSTMDVYANMRAIENVGRVYAPDAKYLRYRRVLVDWMCEVGEDFHLAPSTMHVAIGYLDRILQQVVVAKNRLQLVAMCCVLVAAKYEEAEEDVPSVRKLNEYAHNSYQQEMITHTEVLVLSRLGWSLTVVTSLHFLGYYFAKGVVFTSDTMAGKPLIPKVPRYVQKYMNFFADLCQQEYSFQQYAPSLLAAAIAVASRKALNIVPTWTPQLETVVCYREADLEPCFEHIWRYFKENFPAQAGVADEKDTSPMSVSAV